MKSAIGAKGSGPRIANAGSHKHHYIPEFYLKQWAGPDGRLCEFSRPYDKIKARMTHPGGTGYVKNLYSIADDETAAPQYLEDIFLKIADQRASDVLRLLLDGRISDLNVDTRSGWSRFILSLIHRSPEEVARLKAKTHEALASRLADIQQNYESFRNSSDPSTFEEFKAKLPKAMSGRAAAMVIQEVIDSARVGSHINQMRWSVVTFDSVRHPLLTSDRPVWMTNGINRPVSYIIMPISPSVLFVAVNNENFEAELRRIPSRTLMERVNNHIVLHSKKFVYGNTDSQLRFVQNRFGKGAP